MYLVFVWWLCQRLPRIMEGSRGFNVTKLNAFLTIPLFRYHMYCMPALQLLMWNLSKNLFNFYTGFKDLIFHHSEMFILISQPSICGSFCFLNGITFQNIMYSYDQILSVLQFDVASILIPPKCDLAYPFSLPTVCPGPVPCPFHNVSWPVPPPSPNIACPFPPCTSCPACSPSLHTNNPASSAHFPSSAKVTGYMCWRTPNHLSVLAGNFIEIIFVVS